MSHDNFQSPESDAPELDDDDRIYGALTDLAGLDTHDVDLRDHPEAYEVLGRLMTHAYGEGRADQAQENAPSYRGYANLGTGMYLMNVSNAGDPAELIISIATPEESAGRVVGDKRPNSPETVIQPEQMAVRLRFETVAGLDALEGMLREVRAEHFPDALRGHEIDA